MDTVVISLSGIEADRFRVFQKYHLLFETLEKNGLFDMQFGKFTINVALGEIQNVIKEEMVMKRV